MTPEEYKQLADADFEEMESRGGHGIGILLLIVAGLVFWVGVFLVFGG